MKCHLFKSTKGRFAITDDREGLKLPMHEYGNWWYQREIEVNPPSANGTPPSDDILGAIQQNGYYLMPEHEAGFASQ